MRRFFLKSLETWKNSSSRKPLLLRGARQVGKTWVVREHAKSYPGFLEINLESHPEYIPLFKEDFGKPDQLLHRISLLSGQKIIPGMLLFIDEIQVSKEALLSLRYFYETLPEQHVIAAGSLLEFTFQELSFPVGRVEYLYLYPFSFREFLFVRGLEDLILFIEECAKDKKSLSQPIHEKILREVQAYFLIGGLPEVVAAYLNDQDFKACEKIQQTLLSGYREDFHKYATRAQIQYLYPVFQSIPRLMGRKFKYSEVDVMYRSRELGVALTLLEQAGLAYKAHHTSAQGLPLGAQINSQKFKVFSLDIGLCQRLLGVDLAQAFVMREDWMAHKGSMAEQFVAQEMISYGPQDRHPELFCWYREARSSQSEVDFVFPLSTPHGTKIVPVEVKSERGHGMKSLGIFLDEKKENSPFGVVISSEGFEEKKRVAYVPFYGLWTL